VATLSEILSSRDFFTKLSNDFRVFSHSDPPATNDLYSVAYLGPSVAYLNCEAYLGSFFEDLGCTAYFGPTVSDLNCVAYLGPVAVNQDLATVAQFINLVSADLYSVAQFHVNVRVDADLLASANFITANELLATANFVQQASLLSSVTFVNSGVYDFPCFAFLGNLKKDLPGFSVFYQYGSINFNAGITIKPYQPPQNLQYSASADFDATMFIRNYTNKNLAASATFIGFGYQNFGAKMTITNDYYGVGGATITVLNLGTKQKSYATSDSSGYFSVSGLSAGNYQISITVTGAIVSPSPVKVTITDENIKLYFEINGTFETIPGLIIPLENLGMCYIVPPGGPGFSIEGFIMPNIAKSYNSIIATAANEDDASEFRQTINNTDIGG